VPAKTARRLTLRDKSLRDIAFLPEAPFAAPLFVTAPPGRRLAAAPPSAAVIALSLAKHPRPVKAVAQPRKTGYRISDKAMRKMENLGRMPAVNPHAF